MPLLHAHNISYSLPTGETLFAPISFTLSEYNIGLIGKNGVGKSILLAMLKGELRPSRGSVESHANIGIYRQQSVIKQQNKINIAEYLQLAPIIDALMRIKQGECDPCLFDIVGDNWLVQEQLSSQLRALGLPDNPLQECATLSGGQLARLTLWKLFQGDHDLLLLDEPSNHLDSSGKNWLKKQIRQCKATVLLVSHDRDLLDEQPEIWELTARGLTVYGGNYAHYSAQKAMHEKALNRKLDGVIKQQKQVQQEVQQSAEKAQQRARQGKGLRGSQAKCLLDSQKERASSSAASRQKNSSARLKQLQEKANLLKRQQESRQQLTLKLKDTPQKTKTVFTIRKGRLVFGSAAPIDLQCTVQTKLHLAGSNGSGKSTLLKTLMGRLALRSGEYQCNTPLYYLDQHFDNIKQNLSVLENLTSCSAGLSESDARTLLAGIGLRRERVHRKAGTLSGGEKMKLAMLIVCHQPEQPFLLLDEPDNHLDIEAKTTLAQALKQYQGGFILVSHDRIFAKETGFTEQYHL